MPEGPSILILKEEALKFKRKKVIAVSGNSKLDISRLKNQTVIDFKTWGKHFLICFKTFTVRIHLMLFGSYRIDEVRDIKPRLSLKFSNGELSFYNCSVKFIEGDLDEVYDWNADILSNTWNNSITAKRLVASKQVFICDALLDQNIFAGLGNIIKNEVLFITKIHPLTKVKALNAKQVRVLVKAVRDYGFQFYKWKKKFEFKKHWQIYKKSICPRCQIPLKIAPLGKHPRRTYFCENCQLLYK